MLLSSSFYHSDQFHPDRNLSVVPIQQVPNQIDSADQHSMARDVPYTFDVLLL